jgi:hypothetical protein
MDVVTYPQPWTLPAPFNVRAHLSADEVDRLIIFKRRYNLASDGFTREQADRLLFVRWLVEYRRLD